MSGHVTTSGKWFPPDKKATPADEAAAAERLSTVVGKGLIFNGRTKRWEKVS